MKKYIVFFILYSTFLFPQIFEIKNISEIEKYITKDSLVIFDLDNTIIEPAQVLGSDQWFCYQLKEYEKESKSQALKKTLNKWFDIQYLTKAKLVEDKALYLINKIQKEGILLMALTTRNEAIASAAIRQLDSLGINFQKNSPSQDNFYLENDILFKKGIVFASGKDKGSVLGKFLKKINFSPKSIIFVDDKKKNITEIDAFCKLNKINYLGFRYGYLDEKIKKYNPKIADIQYQKLNISILSDEKALKFLNN